jgi:hypothetical protein
MHLDMGTRLGMGMHLLLFLGITMHRHMFIPIQWPQPTHQSPSYVLLQPL